jgi:hypothetical protein
MRRLTRVLARFDRSGNCASIYPAIETIAYRLSSTELNYPEPQRFKWSRATVFRYLKRLKERGLATSEGLSAMHGTRRRVLHPKALLLVPRESETPARRESETGFKDLDSKKLQRDRKNQNHPADDAARLNPPVRGKPSPSSCSEGLGRFAAIARRNILNRTAESPEAVDLILRTVIARAAEARTVIHSPAYLERGFDSQIADDAAQLERGGAELVAAASEMRRKLAFVRECVEQAAREGRSARDVLAERLPP